MDNSEVLSELELEIFDKFSLNMSKNTKIDYISKIIQFKKYLGFKSFEDVNRMDCESFIDKIRTFYAKSTCEKVYSYLHSFFNYLKKEGYININPFDNIEKPCVSRIKNKEDVLSIHEINKILEVIPKLKSRDACIMLSLITTGCILSELVNLKWKDIYKKSDNKYYIRLGCGRKKRTLAVHPYLLRLLKNYRDELGLKEEIVPNNYYIYVTQKSDSITDRNVRVIVKKVLGKVGLDNYSARDFRHSYAAINLLMGMNEEELKNKLGWSDKNYAYRYKYVINFLLNSSQNEIFNI